jgi:hypothetical protein
MGKDTLKVSIGSLLIETEVIALDNADDALVGNDCRIFLSDNYIGIYSSSVHAYKLFSRKGEYLRTIATRGQGPNDFIISIYDSYIDESEGKIYLLPIRADKILVFDLQGNALPSVPMAYMVHKGRFRMNAEETVTLTVMPFANTPSVVWEQDFTGKVLREIPTAHFVICPSDYSHEVGMGMNVASVLDFSLFRWMMTGDSLYHYNEAENTLNAVFTTRFSEDMVHMYTELPNYYVVQLIIPSTPTYTPPSPTILIDKGTLRGSYVTWQVDALGDIACPKWITFDRGYLTSSIHPAELKEKIDSRLQQDAPLDPAVKERMVALNEGMTEDDNTVLIVGRLKQE